MAHKYDITDLATVANSRLACENLFCGDTELVTLTDFVFKNTAASCTDIRSVLVAECLRRMEKPKEKDEFVALLVQLADLGSSLVLQGHMMMLVKLSAQEELFNIRLNDQKMLHNDTLTKLGHVETKLGALGWDLAIRERTISNLQAKRTKAQNGKK